MKKKCKPKKFEIGGINGGPLTPEEFQALDPVEQQKYLASLSPADRLKMQFMPALQPQQSRSASAITSPADPPPPAERLDVEAGIKGLQPNLNTSEPVNEKGILNQVKDRLGTLAGISATLTDVANMSDPSRTDIGVGAVSGAVQGAAGGMALGPGGMIGGALFGALTGALKSGTQREAFDEQEQRRRKGLLTGLRVAPSIQEKGGPIINEEAVPERPVQMEEGEVMLFEDGRIVDAMAKKRHKSMKDEEVTDIIPTAFIFSDSKKRLIDLAKIKDDIFTITRGHYSEDGNTPLKTVTMGDVYGTKGKVTPATMAKKVRKDVPIIENPVEDIERRTNQENLKRRAELLAPIMKLQEGIYKKFEFEKPEKYEEGGLNDFECPEGYQKDAEDRCYRENPETGEIEYYSVQLDEVTVTDTGRKPLNPALPIKPIPTTPNIANPLEAISAYRKAQNPTPTTLAAKSSGVATPASTGASGDGTDMFAPYQNKLSRNEQRIDSDYASSAAEAENLFRKQRLSNLAVLGTRLAGISMQNPEQTPVQQGTEHVDSMFPMISEAQIQSQTQALRQGQNRTLSAINNSGISGTQIGSAVASTQARLIEGEGDLRVATNAKNLSQNALRFAKLHSILNTNRANEVEAENATRSNRNRMISNIAGAGGEFVGAQAGLTEALSTRLAELKKWRQESRDTNEQKQLDLEIRKVETNMKKEQQSLDRKYMEAAIDKLLTGFKI